MESTVRFLAAVVWGLGMAACGGGGEQQAAAPAPTADPAVVLERAGMPGGDACALLTRADAEALFGRPAERRREPVLAGRLAGRCLWVAEAGASTRRLELRILRVPALAPPPDAEPFDLGVQGYVRADPAAGVEVAWLQGGLHYALVHTTTGPAAPPAIDRAEEVKALARAVASRL